MLLHACEKIARFANKGKIKSVSSLQYTLLKVALLLRYGLDVCAHVAKGGQSEDHTRHVTLCTAWD